MSHSKILVVEDDLSLREALCDTLQVAGYAVTAAADGVAALDTLARQNIGMVIADVQMPRMDGHALLKRVKAQSPQLPVLLMTAYGTIQHAVAAMRDGATDYLVKPFEASVLTDMVKKFFVEPANGERDFIAIDARTCAMMEVVDRVAASEATIMISGESGSGKEVLARYIHRHSRRRERPFVAINCAAIPENMLEAILFGYEKGAFTGASQSCPGKFEQAQGGTLLLDEISEMNLALQAKLLRVLQEREVERLGGRNPISLDVRVLATSNRIMREEVAAGRFREDLFYRLNVFPIHLPPLRERRQDIIPIARRLLSHHAAVQRRQVPEFSPTAQQCLFAHAWPGNVRELENVVQRALIMQRGDVVYPEDLPLEAPYEKTSAAVTLSALSDNLGADLKTHEQHLILEALKAGQGSRKIAAEKLGISPRTLRYKLARLREAGIVIPRRIGIENA